MGVIHVCCLSDCWVQLFFHICASTPHLIFYLLFPSLRLEFIPHLLLRPRSWYHCDASTFASHLGGFLLLLFSFHSPDTPAAMPWYFLFPRVNQAALQIKTHLCNWSYFSWWLTHTHSHGYTQHISFITQYVIPSGMLLGRLLTDKQICDRSSWKCDAGINKHSYIQKCHSKCDTCALEMTAY